ncbi:MAG TPA: hypothetical protein VI141_06420, partial [Acidimicrobiia bacterium]
MDVVKSLTVPRATYFVSSSVQARVRRPQDLFTALFGLGLFLWAATTGDTTPVDQVATVSPPWVTGLLRIGYLLSLVYAVVVVGALIWGGKERRLALRDVAIVAVAASALVVLVSFMLNGSWPYVLPEIDLENPVPRFPVMRVAVVTAILVTVGPHSTQPM